MKLFLSGLLYYTIIALFGTLVGLAIYIYGTL